MTQAKICGICREEDAALAMSAGAHWLGVILAPGRSRTRTVEEARRIFGATTGKRVGVFVDADVEQMSRIVQTLALDVVQLHGNEDVAAAQRLRASTGAEIWKAVSVRTPGDVIEASRRYVGVADGLVLDGWTEGASGGAGVSFDWNGVAAIRSQVADSFRLIVAGGLKPENVAEVIALLSPDVVDVSSGVEESLCRKSAERVLSFIAAVRGAGDRDGRG